jgi:hypothetical protein
MGFLTAQQIINRASIMLGLGGQTAPFTSNDPNVVQLREMLNSAGEDLVREFEWAHLRKEFDTTTVPNQDTYTLPQDFNRFVNQTEWNRSSKLPLGGPVTPQGWQLLKTLNVIAAVQMFFRTKANTLILLPVPAGAYDLALEYLSGWWVSNDGGSTPSGGTLAADTDVVLLDGQMMVHRIRRDWQDAKGFDSTAASNAYEAALNVAKGNDEAAPVLNLNHNPYNRARLLDGTNLPPTGYGTA